MIPKTLERLSTKTLPVLATQGIPLGNYLGLLACAFNRNNFESDSAVLFCARKLVQPYYAILDQRHGAGVMAHRREFREAGDARFCERLVRP